MNWFSTNCNTFPPAVKKAQLPEETIIHENYKIVRAVRVSGTELTYLAEDIRTQGQVYLHELLPMRWCVRSEENIWTPYHETAENEFAGVKTDCINKFKRLQELHEESALMHITEVFEALGTVWTVTECDVQESLAEVIGTKMFTPQEAITLLAPVMDTLAGLHAESIFHGAVSAHSIFLQGEDAVLVGWCAPYCDETAPVPSVSSDVHAVSTLIYRLITGEQVYSGETAAALPSGIRAALREGMESEDMTMEQLWKQLHADKASKRMAPVVRPSGNSKLGHLFTPGFTVLFCVICCILPIALGLIIWFGGGLRDSSYSLSEEDIRVPELLYMTQEEAVQTAEALGLHVIIAAREDNPVVEENLVVTQKPSAGSILTAGETIQLTISDGWSNYVPNVCNMLREEAVALLEELGFIVEYKEIHSAGDAPNTVISQSVKPETNLPRDSKITLTVSLGREDVDTTKLETVGNYVGMNFEEAKALLSELHLYAFQAEAVYDPLVPEGVVISQEIPEGRKVAQGSIINMTVSLGVETVRLPHVVLMNVNAAKAMLEELGLKAVLMYVADGGYAVDCIISQNTPGGELVPVGSEVWLTVSTGTANTIISTGGWSGAPLPTVDTTETTAPETMPSESTNMETLPTETDPIETDATDNSETVTETDVSEPPTEESTQILDTSAPSETEATETEPVPSETAAPTTEPPATETQAATDQQETVASE